MAFDGASVGKPERVVIKTPPPAPGAEGEELPLRLAVVGDFTGKEDDTKLADRKVRSVNKKNFSDIMASMDISTTFTVKNTLSGGEGEELPVNLKIDNIKDFRPEEVAQQVPQIRQLVEFRKELVDLLVKVGQNPDLAKKLTEAIKKVSGKVGQGQKG